jgi:hypothetical protein
VPTPQPPPLTVPVPLPEPPSPPVLVPVPGFEVVPPLPDEPPLPPPVVTGCVTGTTGTLRTVAGGVTIGVTAGAVATTRRIGVTTAGVDRGFARRTATCRLGGVFSAGVAGAVPTAGIPTGELAVRAAGASPTCEAGLVAVADPTANAIPNAATSATASSSRTRRGRCLDDARLGALRPSATAPSLVVVAVMSRPQCCSDPNLRDIIARSSRTIHHGFLVVRGRSPSCRTTTEVGCCA